MWWPICKNKISCFCFTFCGSLKSKTVWFFWYLRVNSLMTIRFFDIRRSFEKATNLHLLIFGCHKEKQNFLLWMTNGCHLEKNTCCLCWYLTVICKYQKKLSAIIGIRTNFFLLRLFGGRLENENVCYLLIYGSQLEKLNVMLRCGGPFGKAKKIGFTDIWGSID